MWGNLVNLGNSTNNRLWIQVSATLSTQLPPSFSAHFLQVPPQVLPQVLPQVPHLHTHIPVKLCQAMSKPAKPAKTPYLYFVTTYIHSSSHM